MKIESKHVDLKLRSGSIYLYETSHGFSKKSNEIFIRSKVYFSSIGDQLYPVEVADQFGNVVFRIAVTTKVPYPTIAPHQILNVKMPMNNLDQDEPF